MLKVKSKEMLLTVLLSVNALQVALQSVPVARACVSRCGTGILACVII
jgi:hypothetical protein